MKAYEVIAERIVEIGITKAELARRMNIDDELLRRSLLGKRKISADEFVTLCYELGLKLSDFDSRRPRRWSHVKKGKGA